MGKNYSEVIEISPASSEKESRGGIVSTMANSSSSSCSSEEDRTPIRPVFCLKSKSVTDIKRIEETEDCFILEFDPFESIDLSSLSINCNASETDADGSNDLSVIAEKGQVACRDYPHSRHLCLIFPFETTAHENFCELLLHASIGQSLHQHTAMLQRMLEIGSTKGILGNSYQREFSDPVVAEATLDFLNLNKKKLLTSFPTLLPQFFPLLLKLIAWNGERAMRVQ